MLTPAISASSTSSPRVMRSKASCTHVFRPPFLYWFPLAEATTTGRDVLPVDTAGAWAVAGPAASTPPAAALVLTKSRRVTLGLIASPAPGGAQQTAGSIPPRHRGNPDPSPI